MLARGDCPEGGEYDIGIKFITGSPPPAANAPKERPGRIEYLFLTDVQKIKVALMNEAIDNLPSMVRLRCQNPEVKTTQNKPLLHFAHIDYDERTPPSEEQADLMCRSSGVMCPLAEMCYTLGLALDAPVGVWGGRVLVDGTDYYQKENN